MKKDSASVNTWFMNQIYNEGGMDINEISRNFFTLVVQRAVSGNC
jgi:hypothetical protein